MLIRWIIIVILGYLLYRFFRRFLSSPRQPKRKPPQEIQDEMVQDPVCKVYLPKRQALILNSSNRVHYYFCSQECREKFIEQAKQQSSS
jgi:YHS domain-containing protein